MNGLVCVLESGRRIRFSLKKRKSAIHFISRRFGGETDAELERSTKEPNQRRAIDAAIAIIRDEFAPKSVISNPSWDEAVGSLSSFMGANNLRESTIADYEYSVRSLRQTFPKTHGPGEITPAMAERFKLERLKAGCSPYTVRGDLTTLKVVFGKWWCRVGKILAENPFAAIEKPKVERQPPRVIDDAERAAFLAWIEQRWSGWRIPILFLEVKNFVGCRISELASTRTDCLKNGRLYFVASATKGRKQRAVKLPPQIFSGLQGIAGKTFVFEAFSAQRRAIHIRRRNPHHAATIRDYTPKPVAELAGRRGGTLLPDAPGCQEVQAPQLSWDGNVAGEAGWSQLRRCFRRVWLPSWRR